MIRCLRDSRVGTSSSGMTIITPSLAGDKVNREPVILVTSKVMDSTVASKEPANLDRIKVSLVTSSKTSLANKASGTNRPSGASRVGVIRVVDSSRAVVVSKDRLGIRDISRAWATSKD